MCTIMEERRKEMCVRGYHVYKEVWDAIVVETLQCEREDSNERDSYTVVVTYNFSCRL